MNNPIIQFIFWGGWLAVSVWLWYSGYYERHPLNRVECIFIVILILIRLFSGFFMKKENADRVQEISSKVNNGGWSSRIGGSKTYWIVVILVVGVWVFVSLRMLFK